MKARQTALVAVAFVLCLVQVASASYTIPVRPVYFPVTSTASITFNKSILPLTFTTLYRDTANRWYFNNTWMNTTTTMIVTAFHSGNWLNYTVTEAGTQQVSNGSRPTEVWIDGVNTAEGAGWTYTDSTITVTTATGAVAICWVSSSSVFPADTSAKVYSVSFRLTSGKAPAEDYMIQVWSWTTGTEQGVQFSDHEGLAFFKLARGEYQYTINHRQDRTSKHYGNFTVTGNTLLPIDLTRARASSVRPEILQAVLVMCGAAAAILVIVFLLKARK